ncbi:entericidin A/B family lipoprotein [Advenella sp. EE-W14]|jgi:entericidin B|nr:entericidin A/B family lipoprotein [Advenella sp. EE-W14]
MNLKNYLITALISLFALTGCNTVKGLGEDISAGGQAIERAAQ